MERYLAKERCLKEFQGHRYRPSVEMNWLVYNRLYLTNIERCLMRKSSGITVRMGLVPPLMRFHYI